MIAINPGSEKTPLEQLLTECQFDVEIRTECRCPPPALGYEIRFCHSAPELAEIVSGDIITVSHSDHDVTGIIEWQDWNRFIISGF